MEQKNLLFRVESFFQEKRWGMALVIGILAIAGMGLTFQYVLTHTDTISGRYDVYRYFGPISYYLDASLHTGHLPLWNPLTYCGTPFAANPQAAVFYPPNIVRSLLNVHPSPHSTQVSLVILMALHLLFLFGGTYLLARSHGVQKVGAITAAIAFTFSALMVRRACEYHFVTVLAWLPFLLVVVKKSLDARTTRKRVIYALAAGMLLGMGALAGFLQIVNYMGVSLLVYAIGYRLLNPIKGISCSRTWVTDGTSIVLVVVLGALTAAALLIPAAELGSFSARNQGEEISQYANLLHEKPLDLLQDLVVFPGMKYEAEALRGSGVAALLLAFMGLWSRRWRQTAVFAALYAALVDCSFGPPFPLATLVTKLTPFSISVHTRAYDVALLPLSILAGFGVDTITELPRSKVALMLRTAFLVVVGGLLLMLLVRCTVPHPFLPVNRIVVITPALAVMAMIVAPYVNFGGIVRLVLALFVFTEMFVWNEHYVPFLTAKKNVGDITAPTSPEWPLTNSRSVDYVPNRLLYTLTPVINGYEPLHLAKSREIIADPQRLRRYHRIVEALEPYTANNRGNAFLKRWFWLSQQYAEGTLPNKEQLFPCATTVFLQDAAPKSVPKVTTVPANALSDTIFQVKRVMGDPLPDAVTSNLVVGRGHVFDLPTHTGSQPTGSAGCLHAKVRITYSSDRTADIEIRFRDRSARKTDVMGHSFKVTPTNGQERVIEMPAPDFAELVVWIQISPKTPGTFNLRDVAVFCDLADEDSFIKVLSISPNNADVEVGPLPAPRILTFVDAAYPGWRATVDGTNTPIFTANDAFKAVEVPTGIHRVRFEFQPWRIYAGMAISAVSALAAMTALFFLVRHHPLPLR